MLGTRLGTQQGNCVFLRILTYFTYFIVSGRLGYGLYLRIFIGRYLVVFGYLFRGIYLMVIIRIIIWVFISYLFRIYLVLFG